MKIKNELIYREYITREEQHYHASYAEELSFYNTVKSGDVETINKSYTGNYTMQPGLGQLSENAVQSAKYHFVIAAALIARYCIEAGMEHELAFTASDMYINKVDKCTNTDDISALQYEMIMYYTNHMNKLRTSNVYSLPVTKCIEYIYNHLHTQIRMEELTSVSGLSAGYLSRLFRKETGQTISSYVRNRKLDTAKNMLIHSDYPMSTISETLCFASQSYFIETFKKYTGVTPAQFRKLHARKLEI